MSISSLWNLPIILLVLRHHKVPRVAANPNPLNHRQPAVAVTKPKSHQNLHNPRSHAVRDPRNRKHHTPSSHLYLGRQCRVII
jgi:hypothetical protein